MNILEFQQHFPVLSSFAFVKKSDEELKAEAMKAYNVLTILSTGEKIENPRLHKKML